MFLQCVNWNGQQPSDSTRRIQCCCQCWKLYARLSVSKKKNLSVDIDKLLVPFSPSYFSYFPSTYFGCSSFFSFFFARANCRSSSSFPNRRHQQLQQQSDFHSLTPSPPPSTSLRPPQNNLDLQQALVMGDNQPMDFKQPDLQTFSSAVSQSLQLEHGHHGDFQNSS